MLRLDKHSGSKQPAKQGPQNGKSCKVDAKEYLEELSVFLGKCLAMQVDGDEVRQRSDGGAKPSDIRTVKQSCGKSWRLLRELCEQHGNRHVGDDLAE